MRVEIFKALEMIILLLYLSFAPQNLIIPGLIYYPALFPELILFCLYLLFLFIALSPSLSHTVPPNVSLPPLSASH